MKTASQIIDAQVPTLSDDFEVSLALRLMDECGITELPIVVNGLFKGLISESQLLDIDGEETFMIRSFPLDWMIKQQLRPTRGIPVVA